MRKENWFLSGLFRFWKEKKRLMGVAYIMAVILTILSIGEYYLFIPQSAMARVKAETVEDFLTGQYAKETENRSPVQADNLLETYNNTAKKSSEETAEQAAEKLEKPSDMDGALDAPEASEAVRTVNEAEGTPKVLRNSGIALKAEVLEVQTLEEYSLSNAEKLEITAAREETLTSDRKAKAEAEEAIKLAEKRAAELKMQEEVRKALNLGERVYDVTAEDVEVLQRIVEAEATGEDIKGKILVANVVLNRMKSESFPDTISEVVFQKSGNCYQFSPIRDKRYWSVEITQETVEAVERALAGEDYSEGALYFAARKLASKKNMNWFDNNLTYLFRHGCHEFFK